MPVNDLIQKTCTTCPYCGVGCGVIAIEGERGDITVKGDEAHPANFGKLCSKGSSLAETLGDEGRLLYPQIAGQCADWDTALGTVAQGFKDIISKHGPDAVAFYVSGQFLTEDYYVANKLMKGYIGSGNIDTNSRLCMASSVVGHKRAFGSDTVPGCYEDLELADLIILTGSNLAWCHPILYQRIIKARTARPQMKIVVIDPRETALCDQADLHLALRPGSDISLFQGLLNYLDDIGCTDVDYIKRFTDNSAAARESAALFTLEKVTTDTGLPIDDIEAFYKLFGATPKTVTVYSQGVNQAADGSDKVNAIINCHLLTGRIGKRGSGPFSVTGQPNAMGGREVGGLANQLASHMDIANPMHRDVVQRFWDSPVMADKAGFLAVDMFEAIHEGKIKAIWIMATNPVVSMPNANRVRKALQKCEMVVVSDIYANTDTAKCADIVLPATGWGEKSGTVTNSERRISRQRSFLSAPGEAKDDWWQLCELAKRMGYEGFDFDSPAAIFREYASLCGYENGGTRDLDLTGLQDISDADYDALLPVQWPVKTKDDKGRARLFGDNQFFTQNKRAQFVVPAKAKFATTTPEFPLTLNTGRIRDHWHTMTRTGRSPRLSGHIGEPFVDIHPYDADRLGLGNADIARLSSPHGTMLARCVISKRQRGGSVFVPMHFTDSFASKGRVDTLIASVVDAASGQPAFKSTAVNVQRFTAQWYGFAALIATDTFDGISVPKDVEYWAKSRTELGHRLELAGLTAIESWPCFLRDLLGGHDEALEIIDMQFGAQNQTRIAAFKEGKLTGLLFIASEPVSVSRDWAARQLGESHEGAARHLLLAGRPGDDMPDKGAIVCACMNVGINDIKAAILKGCATVDALGDMTTAGTNCGSCQPEMRTLLKEAQLANAIK